MATAYTLPSESPAAPFQDADRTVEQCGWNEPFEGYPTDTGDLWLNYYNSAMNAILDRSLGKDIESGSNYPLPCTD